MKKVISVFLSIFLVFALTSCSDSTVHELNFSMSKEEIEELDGKTVSIIGYMSLVTPIDNLIYITRYPIESHPETAEGTMTLINAFAVNLKEELPEEQYTTQVIKITGKLVCGKFTDDYSYYYTYRIEDATFELATEEEIPENIIPYYTMEKNNYVFHMYDILSCIDFYVNYEEFDENKEFKKDETIDFFNYQETRDAVSALEGEDYELYIEIWDGANALIEKINDNITEGKYQENKNLHEETDVLYEKFETLMNGYVME